MNSNAYAKINLSLDVLGKKTNGYHIISTVFASIDLYDVISISKRTDNSIIISSNNTSIPLDESNLVYKASKYMTDKFKLDCGFNIDIEKNIPVGAGLGGGSSDCAATIRMINEMFELDLDSVKLAQIGSNFGADVAYCTLGGVMLGTDLGQNLEALKRVPPCYIVIAKPMVSLSTREVYQDLNISMSDDETINKIIINTSGVNSKLNPMHKIIDSLENQDISMLARNMFNKLEDVSITKAPIIKEIKNIMKDHGAINSLMSGSGSSVFGIYDNLNKAISSKEKLDALLEIESVFISKPV